MRPFDPPAGLAAEAKRVFDDSGLAYGTVDFLFGNEEATSFVVCETNACPGFEALEGTCGIDAARAVLLAAIRWKGAS
jgi:glutathione synthase/RimK-type ligase-like ATP-grasp enzyme